MKKLFGAAFIICLVFALVPSADAQVKFRGFTALTGGGTGALDKIPIAELTNGDIGFVATDTYFYVYKFVAASTEAESSPNYIRPNDYSTSGVWVLTGLYGVTLKGGPSATPTLEFYDSDATDGDINGKIYLNCTTTTSGAENCEIYFQNQVGGSLATRLTIDASGNVVATGDITVTGADITLGAAGVKLTGSNGSLTILGLGDGQDEDVKIDLNTTANQITVSSPASSATAVSFSALNLVTTGSIQGGIKISSDADGMDASAMTSAGMYGTLFIATGAGTWILPTAAVGMSACLMDSGTAHDLVLDATAGDTIRLKGTEGADGATITNATGSTTGDFVCVVAVAANKWSTVGMAGTWTVP